MKSRTVKAFCVALLMTLAVSGERGADAATAGKESWITSWAATPGAALGQRSARTFRRPRNIGRRDHPPGGAHQCGRKEGSHRAVK